MTKSARDISAGILAGVVLALVLAFLSATKIKWIVVLAACLGFPIYVYWIGSFQKALMSVLILSLATQMRYNPFYSQVYVDISIGIRISLTILVLLALYIVTIVTLPKGDRGFRLFKPVTIPFFLIVAWSGATVLFAEKPQFVTYQFLQALESFLVYFYVVNYVKTKEDVVFILKCISVTLILTSLLTIAQYFKPTFLNLRYMGWSDDTLSVDIGRQEIIRPGGFLGHANNLASFLAAWLPLVFIFWINFQRRYGWGWLYFSALSLGMVALFLTYSRGGWLAFVSAIGVIYLAAFFRKERHRFPRMIPRLVLILLVAVAAVLPVTPKIYERFTGEDNRANESRIRLIKEAVANIQERPLAGYGFGYHADFRPVPVHNVYLHMAVELGVVAAVLFLWLLFEFLRYGFRGARSGDDVLTLASIGLTAGLIGAYMHSMVELGTIGSHKLLTYFFIGGMLVALGNMKRYNIGLRGGS